MPHDSNGRIFVDRTQDPPVGIDPADVAYVLGRRSRDYGHLCGDTDDPMDGGTVDRGGKINMMSRRKPTQYTGLESDDVYQPIGGGGGEESLDNGKMSCGVEKPFMTLYYSQYNSTGAPKYITASGGNLLTPWSAASKTRYRILDFDGYAHTSYYPDSNSEKPYIVSANCFQPTPGQLDISVQLRYRYEDLPESHQYSNKVKHLGLKSLFCPFDTEQHPVMLGFIAYVNRYQAPPVALVYIASAIGVTDPTTGYDNLINIAVTVSVSSVASSDMFYYGEVIKVVPVLARRITLGGQGAWLLFSFGYKSVYSLDYTLTGTPTEKNTSEITGLSVTYTLSKNELTGEYIFYINRATDFAMSSGGNGYMLFDNPAMQCAAGDGNTSVVSQATITMGTQDPNWLNRWKMPQNSSKRYDASNINGWSSGATPQSRVGSFVLKPNDGVSSFVIGGYFGYMKGLTDHVGKRAQATVNVNAQTGDTFTLTFI